MKKPVKKAIRARRKTDPVPGPPPALQFEILRESLPPVARAAIEAGGKCTVRQYAAVAVGAKQFRSRVLLMVDGKPVAETEVTWREDA